jgi:hypothetical protein
LKKERASATRRQPDADWQRGEKHQPAPPIYQIAARASIDAGITLSMVTARTRWFMAVRVTDRLWSLRKLIDASGQENLYEMRSMRQGID